MPGIYRTGFGVPDVPLECSEQIVQQGGGQGVPHDGLLERCHDGEPRAIGGIGARIAGKRERLAIALQLCQPRRSRSLTFIGNVVCRAGEMVDGRDSRTQRLGA